jgi:hypothetical protein
MMPAGMAAGFPSASASGDAPVSLLVRVSLPDRPGALGLVASRIGAVRGDIVGIDVLERSSGSAVDEFGVVLPSADLMPLLIREIEQAGARVEDVVVVAHMPDPRRDALEAAVRLCEATTIEELYTSLAAHTGRSLLADWVTLVRPGEVAPEPVHSWGKEPPERPGLEHAEVEHLSPESGQTVISVRLPGAGLVLLAGRAEAAFRERERTQLEALAVVADRVWALLS